MGGHSRILTAAVGATMVVTTAACGLQPDRAAAGDTLRVVSPLEVHDLAPATSDGILTRLEIAETLVTADTEGAVVPGLATGWTESEGGRTWTFDLPEGATFHDGSDVTGETVAASLRHAVDDPASPLTEAQVEDVVAEGETGVRFELAEPYPVLPALLTHYSAAVLAPSSYDDDGHVTEAIGSGPYRVAEAELPASLELEAFDDWRGEAPEVENVSFQSVGRAESRALLAAGDQADVVFGLEPAGRERVEESDGVGMESSLQPRTLMLKVNNEHPVLGDVRVRRALSLGLDREAMAQAVLRERELAATQLMPPSLTTWNDPELAPLEHDAAAAEALLEDAGWTGDGIREKDGEPLRLTLLTYPDRAELPALATAMQASLREIGVDLDVEVTNSSEIPAAHADGSLELALVARHFALVSDPLVTVADTFKPGGSDWGATGWDSPTVDRAVDSLLAGPPETEAAELRAAVTGTVHEELPVIPVAWYRLNAAVSDRVDGFVIDPLETSWRLSQVELAP